MSHLDDGLSSVLIAAASTGELLLNTVLKLMLLEEGTPHVYDDLVATRGLKTRLKREYAARLGGSWSLDQTSSPVGEWWAKVQVVRGRVLHGGYWPRHVEADEALGANEALERFLDARLASACARYPRTALSKLASDGLRKYGVPEPVIAATVEAHDQHLPDFWRDAGGAGDLRQPD